MPESDDVSAPTPESTGGVGEPPDLSPDTVLNLLSDSSSGVRSWTPPSIDELSQALPQFEIISFVARGAMGAVYKGLQSSLRRVVAIKVLRPDFAIQDPSFAIRFKREAQAMARLSHPNIAVVFEAGETKEGVLYFVMEFVGGSDLRQLLLKQGRLEPRQAVAVASAVCEALAYAHENGVIHRDIKPSNIILDQQGRVKVADFGLAKVPEYDAEMLTLSGTTVGTPDYAAPETLIPGAETDQRADLYAVGVMLYQMLTGRIPRGRFEKPSGIIPQIDPRLDAIVDLAMQNDREKRYSSAREMLRDLKAVADGPDTTVPDHEPPKPVTSRARLLLVSILVAALIVGGWGSKYWTRNTNIVPQPHRAITLTVATKESPYVNSLGMKFVPVPITGGPTSGQWVLFSVWETRVQDYEVFAHEVRRDWPQPGFSQGPTHPAVNLNWDDAQAFCAWLTGRERKAGLLGVTEQYRLPTDHEWSCAVGIGEREDPAKTPEEKSLELTDLFPWGGNWPLPSGAGNYSGDEAADRLTWKGQSILHGYRDNFPYTAPVGTFAANRFGLFDLGGNAWEWCEDRFNAAEFSRVMRGASFNNGGRGALYSSKRDHHMPVDRKDSYGFRVVLGEGAHSQG